MDRNNEKIINIVKNTLWEQGISGTTGTNDSDLIPDLSNNIQ